MEAIVYCALRLRSADIIEPRCAGQIFPLACGDAQALKQLIPGPQGQRSLHELPERQLAQTGIACAQCAGAGGWGGKTGLYFIDMNVNPVIIAIGKRILSLSDEYGIIRKE